MLIYNAINLDIVSSCMIFSYLYIASVDLLQVGINNIIFPFKNKKIKNTIIKKIPYLSYLFYFIS